MILILFSSTFDQHFPPETFPDPQRRKTAEETFNERFDKHALRVAALLPEVFRLAWKEKEMTIHMYEHHSESLLPREKFLKRVLFHFLVASCIVGAALGMGVVGYHVTEHLPWIDALLNASMILGGMGPVNTISTTAGKLFASFYSLFSGLMFIAVAGIVVAPVAHRLLHRLHLPSDKVR